MQKTTKITAVLVGVVGFVLAANGPAGAQAEVGFEMGNVSVGYADGYMDRNHRFHAWEHRADAEQYRAKHADEYRAWKHDDTRHHEDERSR